jgi:hypothetical protein
VGDPQSWNAYTYVRNNPLRLVDPSGLDPECLIVCTGSPDQVVVDNGRCGSACQSALTSGVDWASWSAWIAAGYAHDQQVAGQEWVDSNSIAESGAAASAVADMPAADQGGDGGFIGSAAGLAAEALPWGEKFGEFAAPRFAIAGGLGSAVFAGELALGAIAGTCDTCSKVNQPVVIGESMDRVRAAANYYDAATYDDPLADRLQNGSYPQHAPEMEVNREWIWVMMLQHRRIIDIGIDNRRTVDQRSPYYRMEHEETNSYILREEIPAPWY